MVLGLPARFWNNLEAIYREKIARVEAENALDEDTAISKKLPYKEMARYGWVPNVSSVAEKVINLRKFFEVAQLGNLLNTDFISSIACRRLSVTEKRIMLYSLGHSVLKSKQGELTFLQLISIS